MSRQLRIVQNARPGTQAWRENELAREVQRQATLGNPTVTLEGTTYNFTQAGGRGVPEFVLQEAAPQQQAPSAPSAPQNDPIADALSQLADIFKPAPPPPSPPAPVRQSVGPNTATVERRRVDFGSFAAVATPTGSDFTRRRRNLLGAGI